ncbi:pentapeptide repeat-containing protein [Streptomyces sp. NPDC058000]|uniref:pentapeptide repeat-containing protein n=1 Tax=Streptomyces sp. NPDC058000 TaxID=3346299 RepID=UPI0036E15E44
MIGAVLVGVYAYRKQLIAEGDAHRADASQLADRYTTAAEQLGHEKAAVRLAGVYALARLADDWKEQRQVCVDVLCAYVRMPYQSNPRLPGYKEGELEVRQTIIRVIREHLQQPGEAASWSNCSFDFTGASFDGGDLSHSHFHGDVSFSGATFSSRLLSFHRATFSSGRVSFESATFSGGRVSFESATFSDSRMSFDSATFSHGTVSFGPTTFSNCRLYFVDARFSGGTVPFESATFSGGRVYFESATFSGGKVSFQPAKFSDGTVAFDRAEFSGGRVSFESATFAGGTVSFGSASFSGGTVSFESAKFSNGTVDLHSVTSWAEPPLFDVEVLDNPPVGLLLPSLSA